MCFLYVYVQLCLGLPLSLLGMYVWVVWMGLWAAVIVCRTLGCVWHWESESGEVKKTSNTILEWLGYTCIDLNQ